MRRVLLTPGQRFELFFHLKLSYFSRKKVEVHLQLNSEFGYGNLKRTLLGGSPHSLLFRTANFVCMVPRSILGKRKKRILPSLGTYKILADKQPIFTENFLPVCIIDNHTYFETEAVPEVLEELGFRAIVIGGKNEPDIVAFHQKINPQKIDVEPTLTVEYRLSDLDNDRMKFKRYVRRYSFKRLLAVCESKRISSDVVNELGRTSDPVSLIEFRDLHTLKLHTRTMKDQLKMYTQLTSTGKIIIPYPSRKPILFRSTRFRVERQI